MDDETRVSELKRPGENLCDEWGGDQLYGAKDVTIGIVTEAPELLPNFRFITTDQSAQALADLHKQAAIESDTEL
jgi:hypothetical protein